MTTVTYDVPLTSINALMAVATTTEQYLFKECWGSGIWSTTTKYTYWTTAGGVRQDTYWPGGSAQCDINDGTWRSDGGDITAAADLPVGSVHVGDTTAPEDAYITLGPLRVQ